MHLLLLMSTLLCPSPTPKPTPKSRLEGYLRGKLNSELELPVECITAGAMGKYELPTRISPGKLFEVNNIVIEKIENWNRQELSFYARFKDLLLTVTVPYYDHRKSYIFWFSKCNQENSLFIKLYLLEDCRVSDVQVDFVKFTGIGTNQIKHYLKEGEKQQELEEMNEQVKAVIKPHIERVLKNLSLKSKDTYVKTYLRDGERWLQKRKTRVIRHCSEPQFRQTLRYQACDVLGRSLVVMLWEKQKGFEHNVGLGGAEIAFNRIKLTQTTTGWYPLFPIQTLGSDSNDSP